MRLFQAPLNTCLDSPFFVSLSVHGLHFTVYAPSIVCDSKNYMEKIVRRQKSQNESSPNFSNFRPEFCPEFCSEFSPNFLRSFRASFPGKWRPERIHRKSPTFFNAKFPGKYEKDIHKMFLESKQSKKLFGNYFLGKSHFSYILGGPLSCLNAILSLLHPLDRYRNHSAIGIAIGRPYLALLWSSKLITY